MKKLWVIAIMIGLVSFLALTLAFATEESEKSFSEIKENLQKNGLTAEEIDAAKAPIVEILDKGATKDEIEKPLLDLANNGVKGNDFKASVDSMNDLVKSGKPAKEVGSIVSEAVAQAKTEGLQGTALADKVHQAAKAMQAEKQEAQELKQEQKENKESVETTQESVEKETKKAVQDIQVPEDKGKAKAGGGKP